MRGRASKIPTGRDTKKRNTPTPKSNLKSPPAQPASSATSPFHSLDTPIPANQTETELQVDTTMDDTERDPHGLTFDNSASSRAAESETSDEGLSPGTVLERKAQQERELMQKLRDMSSFLSQASINPRDVPMLLNFGKSIVGTVEQSDAAPPPKEERKPPDPFFDPFGDATVDVEDSRDIESVQPADDKKCPPDD